MITALIVNELRNKTGLGMMECKKYLTESAGNVEAAMELIRKAGVKTSISQRTTGEGRVLVHASADQKSAAVVELLCNTDFTAKSEPVAALLKQAAEIALAGGDPASDAKVKDGLVAVSQTTGENIQLGRVKVLKNAAGKVGTYYYSVSGKIGVIASVTGAPADDLLHNLCLHITAFKPVALGMTREAVPVELIEKERAIAIEEAKATGKPEAIAVKIAEGKLASFFKERVLPEQEFVNPEKFKGSIGDMLKKANVTLVEYARIEVGA